MKVVVAIDSLKGCLSSMEANAAAKEGILCSWPEAEIITVPVSDGGEGWLEAFQSAVGGTFIQADSCDPLMRPIQASYLKRDDLAVIEVAKVVGLNLLRPEERNPLKASSYGIGALIIDSIRRGCTRFIIGLGGSATSDAGIGMMNALSETFGDQRTSFSLTSLPPHLHFTIASDVRNPLCGPNGAASVFAPQKGATPEMVVELDRRAHTFAQETAAAMGYDCSEAPGAGAAGGLGYAFMQFLHADCQPGIDLLLDALSFDDLIADADLVITGEGSADRQTLMGKLPMGILRRAQRHHIPTLLLAGKVHDHDSLIAAGFTDALCINPPHLPLEIAINKEVAMENIRETVRDLKIKELKRLGLYDEGNHSSLVMVEGNHSSLERVEEKTLDNHSARPKDA